jgi:hypothetical protein
VYIQDAKCDSLILDSNCRNSEGFSVCIQETWRYGPERPLVVVGMGKVSQCVFRGIVIP